jgi:hypothetical protein
MPQRAGASHDSFGPHRTVSDGFAAFKSEAMFAADGSPKRRRNKYLRLAAIAAGFAALSASAAVVLRGGAPASASLQIASEPEGVPVRINGEPRGRTPLALSLAPGTYDVMLGEREVVERHRVVLEEAEKTSLHYVLQRQPTAAALGGESSASLASSSLSVITEPAGGAVSIDGTDRGIAPVIVDNLSAGRHQVVVRNQGTVYQRAVTLQPGLTATVFVGTSLAGAAGWLTIQSPLTLQIHEGGSLVGVTEMSRLMLSPGDHQLTLSDEKTGFRVVRNVRITAGQPTTLAIEVPRAAVNVNALPWAEVWIDGQRVGETPLGNHQVPIGDHRVELRHPQFGTKTLTLTVALNAPNRVAVNMREP